MSGILGAFVGGGYGNRPYAPTIGTATATGQQQLQFHTLRQSLTAVFQLPVTRQHLVPEGLLVL